MAIVLSSSGGTGAKKTATLSGERRGAGGGCTFMEQLERLGPAGAT